MVKNIPFDWQPSHFYDFFSSYGRVVGTFIFYTLDDLGKRYGLIEIESPMVAYDLCVKRTLQVKSAVMRLFAADVKSLAEWLQVTLEDMKRSPSNSKAFQALQYN